jgi:diguanylate cyclase (GGDEF)-like protein
MRSVTHWTQTLSNISLAAFVLLAALTTLQWAVRHRRGAGWVALTFVIVGGLALTVKIDPGLVHDREAAKALTAVLVVVPYCLFRFVASFRTPSVPVRILAAALSAALIGFTFFIDYLPTRGSGAPPYFLAYRVSFLVAFSLLFGYVVVRLGLTGRGEPPVAAWRMRLVALAVAGLEVPIVVATLVLHGATIELVTRIVTVAAGLGFLLALVFPSLVRLLLSDREDLAFRRAVGHLVSAGDSKDVADDLLPHVCALVGASEAALLDDDGTVVARYPLWLEGPRPDLWDTDPGGEDGKERVTLRTTSGATHALAVKISPAMEYFGTEELRQLDQLADMVGLAIERCEMAEQMAFQASHDGLTGLANRNLFMERLGEALRHVGRRRSSLAVLFIDLDRFKLVNDRADHSVGDLVLNEMATRLTAMTRGVDVVARFGGDEFVAFAEVDHEDDALDMAERIRQGLSAPITIGDVRLVVTASVGVVIAKDSTTTPAALLREADNAMYEAKRFGRDQVVANHSRARDAAHRRWGLATLGHPAKRNAS